jgi:gamma-glutamyltranspeptidase/glutathione hydrolase/leukotriene-C4 hydrolase
MKTPVKSKSLKKILIAALVVVVLMAIFLTIFLTLRSKKDDETGPGAIVTNGIECAAIGKLIMDEGGSAADVAVATIICEGITCPQSSGLGGGFLLTIYTKETGKVETLNAREVAPKMATEDMYVKDSSGSVRGGKAVAVPGEIKGLWELHQKYGKLPWKKLFEPSVKLARNGHIVSPYLENVFRTAEEDLYREPSLSAIYIDPITNHTYKLNEIIKRPKLAETLEILAEQGADAIYGGGSLGKNLIREIRERGGIMVEEDLLDYR